MPTRASSSFQQTVTRSTPSSTLKGRNAHKSFILFSTCCRVNLQGPSVVIRRNAHKGFILFSTADLRLQKFVPLAHKKNDIFANLPPLWGQKILLNAYFAPPFFENQP